MGTDPLKHLTLRVATLELELQELRALVELNALALRRLSPANANPGPAQGDDRPVDIPDADTVLRPNEELAFLVGSKPRTLRALVGSLVENDLEELRNGPVDELDHEGSLWLQLAALNEEDQLDDAEALAALVRAHSTPVKAKGGPRRRAR